MPNDAQGSKSAVQPSHRSKLALSPSRANGYHQYPLKYRFRTIDKIPEPSTVAQVRDTLVHAVLEQIHAWPREERTYPAAVKHLEPTREDIHARNGELIELVPEDDYYDFLVECRGLLKGHLMVENPMGFDAAEVEKFVQLVIDPDVDQTVSLSVPLHGFIDRVDITPTSEVRIVDYKTGKESSPCFQDKAPFQVRFYALVWWRLTSRILRQLRLMYLEVADGLVLGPNTTKLEAFQAEVADLWSAIVCDGEAGDFVPKKSKLYGQYSFQELCPAYGGATPEYPGWPGPVGDSRDSDATTGSSGSAGSKKND